jgi:pseudouridylate synthase
VSARADNVADIVRLFEIERRLQRPTALVVAVPPPAGFALDRAEVDAAVDRALHEARAQRITGAAVTPFLLAALERATAGRTLRTNVALLANNAALAAQIAVALAQR